MSQATAQARTPIDLAHLGRYTLGNRSLELEILDLFVQQLPATIGRLTAADTQKAWREAAHTLKGSARGVGAWTLADAAARAEQTEGWTSKPARDAALREIELASDEVSACIRALHAVAAA